MGGNFESDGRFKGTEDIKTVTCEATVCNIKLPAPGFALVFLTDQALSESNDGKHETFSTSAYTKIHNTATVDPAVLATSNGHRAGFGGQIGSTSKGSTGGATVAAIVPSVVGLMAIVGGALVFGKAIVR